ncbi:MerR family transcriptional regulator [Flavisolibacter tropicus]|uniref:MerR family transcriptional regulator n=1 Tax=Flavisolibacter tropicus TaxID=1492898 RepID=A0A172TZD8_9BACT|nr:MerR family transcriptional regulator [Flavisolibacter tropicus]ANE52469.1 MerR family transcriptional regulator [Flavisolibacter tropicus]
MGFTIKELETLSGIKAHTIRIWEQRYHFLKPTRTSTNIRTYSNEELKTILTVALLNKHGYKISRIDTMPPEQRNKEVINLSSEEAQNEYLVNELISAMIDLDIYGYETLLNDCIQRVGIEATIKTIIFSFLEKIGILWQTGHINPAHEHIVSNIIRQKLVVAIEGLPFPEQQKPLLLLLLPEDEHHELGLLFVYYLLKQRGLPVIYLGANVPLKDAQYVISLKQPDHIYLHLTSSPSKASFQKYLKGLAASNSSSKVVLSGHIAESFPGINGQLLPLHTLSQAITYISSL